MTLQVNIAELKDNLSKYVEAAERGDEIMICRRNLPIAKITGQTQRINQSKPGWGKGTVQILGEIEGPAIPLEDYNCMRDDHDPLA